MGSRTDHPEAPPSSTPSWADDPPSFTPNHPDPYSWAPGHPDPPFWASNTSQDTHRQLSYGSITSSPSRSTTLPIIPHTSSAERSSLQLSKTSTHSTLSFAENSSLQSSAFFPPVIFQNFPHSLELTESNPRLKLDDCLSRFETNVSPWEDPFKWLRAEAHDLDNILSKLSEKRGHTREYAEAAFPVDGMMVYTVRRSTHVSLYLKDL